MAKRLDTLEQKFLDTIKQNNLINQGDVIVIGVSGGPDSITLLTCLNKYKEKLKCSIIVAHVNHLIREDSTEDEQFVENICKKMNIKFYKKRVDIVKIAKEEKKGTEETARIIRYEFFDEILKKEKANKIAIAHNMNDNAETMLLNLIRGSGLNGLEGIQPEEYDMYIRPLINCTRKEIEEYCEKYKLQPRIDSTNSENIYTRNIIRNTILPQIAEINPNIVEALSRTSVIIKENNNYLKKQAEEEYKKIVVERNLEETEENNKKVKKQTIKLDAKKFNILEKALKYNIILKIIEELQGTTKNIEKVNLDDIIKLAERNVGNKFLKFNQINVKLNNRELCFTKFQ